MLRKHRQLIGIKFCGAFSPLFLKNLQKYKLYAIITTMISKKQKASIIKKYARKEGDTGSPEVQVAILTKRINELTAHLKKNRKDNHSRRGLLQLVADRHSHLRYLKKKSEKRHVDIRKKIGLK